MSEGMHDLDLSNWDLDRSVAQRFAQIAQNRGASTAILHGSRRVTYAELDARSSAIAAAVQSAEDSRHPIFLLFDDTIDAITAMLACLTLGRPYVPLSPSMPPTRMEFIRSDARGSLVLSQRACSESAAQLAEGTLPIIYTDDLSGQAILSIRTIPADTPAWILYTSGSTGKPKGVVQTQRNLMHYVSVYAETQQLSSNDRISLLSSYTANIASHDAFSALLNGATICPYSVREQGVHPLPRWIDETRITVFSCVPTLFRQLTQDMATAYDFTSLRFVKLIGEPVYRRDFEAFLEHFPATCKFVNRLGSSETGTIRWLFADASTTFEGPNLPVGYPVRDNEIRLINEEGAPVMQGEIGEIVVQSAYLAAGYWHRPDLTADAFSGEGLSRTFRTGDMGRMLPDGCLVHVGRRDSQIKIRGYRVEVAEIESALLEHAAISDVLVMLREHSKNDPQLTAYFVTESSEERLTTTELRSQLSKKLPDYMIPSAFMQLDTFPLAPNGKILRSALPAVSSGRPDLGTPYLAPRSPIEKSIGQLWTSVLGWSEIGVQDSFFELGGNSLLATRMLSRIRDEFSVEISMRTVFDDPTIQRLAGVVEEKMARQPDRWTMDDRIAAETALLEQMQYRMTAIQPREAKEPTAPMSYAQQRMWFMEELTPDTPVFNVPWATRLIGSVDIPSLEQAIQRAVDRHGILRTVYRDTEGLASQTTLDAVQIPLQVEQVADEALLESALFKEATRTFDLRNDPPLRATLFQVAAEEHVLLLVGHHIAMDGWSRSILSDEIAAHYRDCQMTAPSSLPTLPIQYADYTAWQQSAPAQEAMAAELSFWSRKLAGLDPTLELPISELDPNASPVDGDAVPFSLSAETVQELQGLARSYNATPFMVLAAGVYAILHRYSGRKDLLIGTPVAGRNRPELESLVGLFVNTLAIRATVEGEFTFAEMVARARDASLEAFEHQDVPFERIVAELGPERQLDRSPLVQIMLSYRTFPRGVLKLEGTEAEPIDVITETSKLDLSFDLWDTDDAIAGRVYFSKRRYRRTRIESLANHFVTLLSAAVRCPNDPIHRLPLLSESDRHMMLQTWNASATPPPDADTVHGLFERAAALSPEKPAVVYEDTQLTFDELNIRANQLAAWLRANGACADARIGVALHRSTDLAVALLGVLKSGAAYLPLDPAFPSARLEYMIDDSSTIAIITQPEIAFDLPAVDIPILSLTEAWYAGQAERMNVPSPAVLPEHLAYVMYTSGSTGKPKGVMVEHRNAVGFLNSIRFVSPATPKRIGSNVITYAFDTSVEEIFATLCYGGTLHIVPYEISLDGRALAEFLLKHSVCSAYVVPDLLPGVAEVFKERGSCGNLRYLRTGLEPKKQRVLQAIRDVAPELQILNAYGPTEVTYGATAYVFESATDPDRDVPIGRPFPDYQTYIVNEVFEPVPIGVPGELLIGGVGVARGYLGRPELTNERFVPNPFETDKSMRLYRSGDAASYLDDGNIEFLGRQDRQVKIRGHRIELREVELALESHPEVVRCHAVVRKLAQDDVRLVAYITQRAAEESSLEDIEDRVRAFLPAYMVPSAIIVLDEFPLLPSGKIDPDALPTPTWRGPENQESSVAPRSETERMLATVWQEILQIDQVSVDEDFFSLGGHSLLATRMLNAIETACETRLTIRQLFNHPTIEALAVIIDQQARDAGKDEDGHPISRGTAQQ